MNTLLESYLVDVKHPDVSGIEHLQMLETRSELAKVEQQLTSKERKALAEADRRLATNAAHFLAELSRFVNLAEERRQRQPEPNEWWWYLDILIRAPALPKRPYQPGTVPV